MDEVVSGLVSFKGAANRPGLDFYKLEYQLEGTTEWILLGAFNWTVKFGALGGWSTTEVPSGTYWVRLVVVDENGNYWPEEAKVRLTVVNEPKPTRDPFEGLRYNPTVTVTGGG